MSCDVCYSAALGGGRGTFRGWSSIALAEIMIGADHAATSRPSLRSIARRKRAKSLCGTRNASRPRHSSINCSAFHAISSRRRIGNRTISDRGAKKPARVLDDGSRIGCCVDEHHSSHASAHVGREIGGGAFSVDTGHKWEASANWRDCPALIDYALGTAGVFQCLSGYDYPPTCLPAQNTS
jgi:hypothetical protein